VNYEFLPEARDELWEATLFYEKSEAGLGRRFRTEVAHIIERILADPHLWRLRTGGYRRVNCPVFPYYVAHFIRADKILIAAVAHGHRRPDYWKDRTRGA
jgi:plasmid stabilization system protein ParE